jgi:hypothetical protein
MTFHEIFYIRGASQKFVVTLKLLLKSDTLHEELCIRLYVYLEHNFANYCRSKKYYEHSVPRKNKARFVTIQISRKS